VPSPFFCWPLTTSPAGYAITPVLNPVLNRATRDRTTFCTVTTSDRILWGTTSSARLPMFAFSTNHFAHAGSLGDKPRAAEYEAGPCKGFGNDIIKGFSVMVPVDASAQGVADAIVNVVDTPFGKRPFRVLRPGAGRRRSGQH
jgi:hypothetical protein